jgi:hypothetical protein
MTEQNVATADEPQGGVPTEVTDELAALASELTTMKEAAERRRMTTIIVFVVVLAIITGYMTFIYTGIKKNLSGKAVAMLLMEASNDFLEQYDMPLLSEPDFGPRLATKLNAQIPGLLATQVKPQIDAFIQRLETDPAGQIKVFEDAVYPHLKKATENITQRMMPAARKQAHAAVLRQVETLLETLEDQMATIVDDVIKENKKNMQDLTPANKQKLKADIAAAFMKELKPRVDEFMAEINLGQKINALEVEMDALVAKIDGKYKVTDEDTKEARKLELTAENLRAGKLTELDIYQILLIQKMTKVGETLGEDTKVDTNVE